MKQPLYSTTMSDTVDLLDASTMSHSTLTNGECENRHGPKADDRRLLFNAFTCKTSVIELRWSVQALKLFFNTFIHSNVGFDVAKW